MSGVLVSAVFASGLAAWLKPWAAVYASYAKDDGSSCWPGIQTVAAALGRQERQARTATAALRRVGILRVLEPPGPHRSTRYDFVRTALPSRGPAQLPLVFDVARFPQPSAAKCSGLDGFPQFAQAYTGSPLHLHRQSTAPDPSVIRQVRTRTRRAAHAQAPARKARR
jgi:hypothetical protein